MDENDLQYFLGDDSHMVASNVYVSAESYSLANDKHNENVTKHLSNAGPVGIAAAAAISSCRYFKSSFLFEIDPVIRRRLQTKLLRKIRSTMDEYSCRVGQQIAMLNCMPSSKLPLIQQFKVYGSKKIQQALKSQRSEIMMELEKFLANKIEVKNLKKNRKFDNDLKELPSLNVEGIPTPLDKMTQSQLRGFIPEMLKLSTGRVKPGWRRIDFCPVWWPADVPWANIRTDSRAESEKNMMSWTDCLRSIVLSCYQYHNCEHLLPDYCANLELVGDFPLPVTDIELNFVENMEGGNTTSEADNVVMGDTIGELRGKGIEMASCQSVVIGDTVGPLQSEDLKYWTMSDIEQKTPRVSVIKRELTEVRNTADEYNNREIDKNREDASGHLVNTVFVSADDRHLKKDSKMLKDISCDTNGAGLVKSEKEKETSERVVVCEVNDVTNSHPVNNVPSTSATFLKDSKYSPVKTIKKIISPDGTPLYYLKMNDTDCLPINFIKWNECNYKVITADNKGSSIKNIAEYSSNKLISQESTNLFSKRDTLDTDKDTNGMNMNNSLKIIQTNELTNITDKYKNPSNINKLNNIFPCTGNKLVLAGKNLTKICLNNNLLS